MVSMDLPSFARSLSEVTFSEPARSINSVVGCQLAALGDMTYLHHRRLNTPSIPSLPCPSWGLGSETGVPSSSVLEEPYSHALDFR